MKTTAHSDEIGNFLYNIELLRKVSGLTMKKMASLLEIGVDSLRRIEKGELPPRLSVTLFFRIYDCFGILPKDQVSGRLDEMPKTKEK